MKNAWKSWKPQKWIMSHALNLEIYVRRVHKKNAFSVIYDSFDGAAAGRLKEIDAKSYILMKKEE